MKINVDQVNNCIKESYNLKKEDQLTKDLIKNQVSSVYEFIKILNENMIMINNNRIIGWPIVKIGEEQF